MAKDNKFRIRTSFEEDVYKQIEYWSQKVSGGSKNRFVEDAIKYYVGHLNGNYDLPTAEVARLNQLIDAMVVLSSNVQSLSDITISGFDSLLGLTRGDNYLLEEDGDIDG